MKQRVIKFRIWDNTMNRWWCEDSQYLQMDGKKIHAAPWSTLEVDLPSDRVHIEQYTGLHDMKGNELYERDILYNEISKSYNKVFFHDGKFIISIYGQFMPDNLYGYHVVGNIHENQELLNKIEE
jgi:hypothetical protein